MDHPYLTYLTLQYYLQGASVDSRYFITYTIYFVLLALELILCCFSDTSALSTSGPSGYHSLVGERQPLLQENGKLKNGGVHPIYAVCFPHFSHDFFLQKFGVQYSFMGGGPLIIWQPILFSIHSFKHWRDADRICV